MAFRLFSRFRRQLDKTARKDRQRRPIGKHERRLSAVVNEHGAESIKKIPRINIEQDIFDGHTDVYRRFKNKIPAIASRSAEYSFGKGDFYCFSDPGLILLYLDGLGSELKKDIFILEIKKTIAEANSSSVSELTEVPLKKFFEIYGKNSQNKLYKIDFNSVIPDDLSKSRKLLTIIEEVFQEVINDLLTKNQLVVRDESHTCFIYIPNLPPDLAKAKVNTILREIMKRVHTHLKAFKRPDPPKGSPAGSQTRDSRPNTLPRDQQLAHQEAKNLDANERNGRPDAFGSRERSASPAEETVDERERRRWERALKEMSALTGSSSARLAALDWDRTIQYTPMWSVKSGLLSTFHCQPLQGEIYIPSAARNVRGVANDDLPALAHALVQADRLACAGVAALILLPLHRLTLQFEPYNTEVVRRCQALSDKAKRHVVFELIEFEADFPQNHFTDIVRQFRSLGRAVLRRVEPDFKGLAALRAVGIQGVSVEVSGGPADEARKILDVDRIAGAAKQARLPLYAIGLPSLSLTLSAMASGCDVLAGEAVAPVTAIPSGATPFNTRSLFPFL